MMSTDLVGNATRDPELRYTPGGLAVASFGLAVNNRRKIKGTDEWEDNTSFFDISCFGSLAENVAETVTKGVRVVVVGRLEQRSWEDKEGGKRSKVEVVADEVGPSLRWASATVTRNEKGGGGGGSTSKPSSNYDDEPFILADPADPRFSF